MKTHKMNVLSLLICFLLIPTASAAKDLKATKTDTPPIIDGNGDDPAWKMAEEIITPDKITGFDVRIKSLYSDTMLYFLVSFPDEDESRSHKDWVWDSATELYTIGHNREDVFVFKWNMESRPRDLSIFADNQYNADIWFWKACRTDPMGYADDKYQILSPLTMQKSAGLASRSGKTMYLLRANDAGAPAFRTKIRAEYAGERIPRFIYQEPSGSRGDVRAKGKWADGQWTLEFARALETGNSDDIDFNTAGTYQFGMSCQEIAGRKPNAALSNPYYGAGDINESITLIFKKW